MWPGYYNGLRSLPDCHSNNSRRTAPQRCVHLSETGMRTASACNATRKRCKASCSSRSWRTNHVCGNSAARVSPGFRRRSVRPPRARRTQAFQRKPRAVAAAVHVRPGGKLGPSIRLSGREDRPQRPMPSGAGQPSPKCDLVNPAPTVLDTREIAAAAADRATPKRCKKIREGSRNKRFNNVTIAGASDTAGLSRWISPHDAR